MLFSAIALIYFHIVLIGIVFNNLENSTFRIQYTIRPAHEVDGEDDENTWNTRDAQPRFQLPGPRVTPK